MALSAVNRDFYAFSIEARKGVLPVVVDIVACIAVNTLSGRKISPNVRWVISAIPAGTVLYLISGFPRWEAGSLLAYWTYLIYKSWTFVEKKQPKTANLAITYT